MSGLTTQTPVGADSTAPTKKRKRTGKEREERKRAAILAAEQGQAANEPQNQDEAPSFQASAVENIGGADAEVEVTETPAGPSVDQEKLATRLPTALKHLHPIFKHAKQTEVQRLIKKIRFLRTKNPSSDELRDLEAQLALLSHLNVTPTSKSHLLLRLRKHHLFKHASLSLETVEALSSGTPDGSSSTLARVENRLCSAKPVADAMKRALAWLVGEEGAKLTSTTPISASEKSSGRSKAATQRPLLDVDEQDNDNDDVDEDAPYVGRGVALGSDDESEDGEEDAFGEAEDAAGWESGSVLSDQETSPKVKTPAGTATSSKAAKPDTTAVSSASAKSKVKTTGKSNALPAERIPKTVTSSLFLPSLSSGFIRGDASDSDPDDDVADGLDGVIGRGKGVEKKNRRGQRARQAIWEKKYGKNAKHIKKATEGDVATNVANAYGSRAGPLPLPSAGAGGSGSGRAPAGRGFEGRGAPRVPAASAPIRASYTGTAAAAAAAGPQVTAAEPAKSLHPSWEAAKLRKQKEMGGSVAGAGAAKPTKIVFD